MEIYTIGFTKKKAEQFFTLLKDAGIRRLLDVRLNNVSQLAGFAKREDLRYFLREICGCEYLHEPRFAPTQEMLDQYKKKKGSWDEYEQQFLTLLADRKVEEQVDPSLFSIPTALLCSERTPPEYCHRRLMLDYLRTKWGNISARHL